MRRRARSASSDEPPDLAPLDLGRDVAQGGGVDAQPQRLGGLARAAGPCSSSTRGSGAADELRPEVGELRERGGVEGARRDAARAERAQPGAQLAGRPRREGERHHPLGRVDARSRRRSAMRCVRARVLPVPAPASTQTGPSSVSAATRCSSSSPASRSSASRSSATPARSESARRTSPRSWRGRSSVRPGSRTSSSAARELARG